MVSIDYIIASYNSASNSYLEECIKTIRGQKFPEDYKSQIIVVDGGSTDNSVNIATKYGCTVLCNEARTELSFGGGKNLAVHYSKADIIFIVDADNLLMEENYAESMIKPLIEDSQICMTIPMPYVPGKREYKQVTRYFCCIERDLWEGIASSGINIGKWVEVYPHSIIVPNGAAIRRSALTDIGGYDYDTEVGFRLLSNLKNKFAIVPTAHRFHIEMESYYDVFWKFKRRLQHQVDHWEEKQVISSQLKSYFSKPKTFLGTRLRDPMSLFLKKHDTCYLQVIPVFLIELLLAFFFAKKLYVL